METATKYVFAPKRRSFQLCWYVHMEGCQKCPALCVVAEHVQALVLLRLLRWFRPCQLSRIEA